MFLCVCVCFSYVLVFATLFVYEVVFTHSVDSYGSAKQFSLSERLLFVASISICAFLNVFICF